MSWGKMPRAVRFLAEETLSCIHIKEEKNTLKETELHYTRAVALLICLKYSAKTYLLVLASSTSDFT